VRKSPDGSEHTVSFGGLRLSDAKLAQTGM
jgi:hypothetical protein